MPPSTPRRAGLRLSAAHRTLALIGALVVIAFVVIASSYVLTEREHQQIQADAQGIDALQSTVTQLSAATQAQEMAIADYLLSADPGSLAMYRAAVADEARLVSAVRLTAGRWPAVEAAALDVSDANAAWRSDFAEPIIAAVSSGTTATSRYLASRAAGLARERRMPAQFDTLALQLDGANAAVYARTTSLGIARTVGTALGLGAFLLVAGVALLLMRRDGNRLEQVASRADVLNRFTEATVFAADDAAIAASNLEAISLLVRPDDGVVHVLNHSQDRAVPLARLGPRSAEILAMSALSRCPGVMRGAIHVTPDVTQPLAVHCPVYATERGTVACVPLAHGDTVGAVHLEWERTDALSLELRTSVARIAEHAALAIGNRRLLLALKGQANTDARTGLANSRAFDQAVETWLGSRTTTESAAVLMLDLDHFKDFNDRHGHPAGDEALRVFADVLRSCVREGDLAARYGGEEFAVLLPNLDAQAALQVAERIRAQTDATIIPLGPGITDRLTVSIGVAFSPAHGDDRLVLLRAADSALYQAKRAGRNRVASLDGTASAERSPRAAVGGGTPAPVG